MSIINGYEANSRIIYGLISFLLVIGFSGVHRVCGWLWNLFGQLGKASYSIYLTHFIFIGIIYKILEMTGSFHKIPVWLIYFSLSVFGIIGGMFVSHTIEYPLMQGIKNYFSHIRRNKQISY